jgi:hypothetical protein
LEGGLADGGGIWFLVDIPPHHYHNNWKLFLCYSLSWTGFASLRSIVVVPRDVCLGIPLRLWIVLGLRTVCELLGRSHPRTAHSGSNTLVISMDAIRLIECALHLFI